MRFRIPHRPARPAPEPPPAPKTRRCPTCGLENAVVFYPVRVREPGTDTRLVCLRCCPPPDDETKT